MSKVLKATCLQGQVMAGEPSLPLPGAVILSEGVGQSEGVAVLDETQAYYLANITPDLETTLEKLISALSQVKTGLDKAVAALGKAQSALTSLDTNGFLIAADAGVPSPPVAASDISGIATESSAITSAANQIETIKGELETLKGALR